MVADPITSDELTVLRVARGVLDPLIATCQKGGRVYQSNPRLVADVNRLGKRLRDTLEKLLREQGVQDA